MRRPGRSLRTILTLAIFASLFAAVPLAAYTIYLKDGKTLQARTKYVLRDGKAYITLQNGTQSYLDAKEIDIPRTERANQKDYGGSAVVLDSATPPAAQAPPPQKRTTVSDLIAARGSETRDLPEARRETPAAERPQATRSKAGFPDFAQMARQPYGQVDVASELQQYFRGQGIEGAELHGGSKADRLMVEITTNSEGSVFRALAISSNALLHVRDRFPDKVAAFELLLMTPSRERAGQFLLTPEMASDLISKKVELTAFYVQNVQF